MAKPVHQIRLQDLRATVWANQVGERTWFNVSITRRFEQDGQFKETSSFGRDDLPMVAKLAEMSYAWIWNQSTSNRN